MGARQRALGAEGQRLAQRLADRSDHRHRLQRHHLGQRQRLREPFQVDFVEGVEHQQRFVPFAVRDRPQAPAFEVGDAARLVGGFDGRRQRDEPGEEHQRRLLVEVHQVLGVQRREQARDIRVAEAVEEHGGPKPVVGARRFAPLPFEDRSADARRGRAVDPLARFLHRLELLRPQPLDPNLDVFVAEPVEVARRLVPVGGRFVEVVVVPPVEVGRCLHRGRGFGRRGFAQQTPHRRVAHLLLAPQHGARPVAAPARDLRRRSSAPGSLAEAHPLRRRSHRGHLPTAPPQPPSDGSCVCSSASAYSSKGAVSRSPPSVRRSRRPSG